MAALALAAALLAPHAAFATDHGGTCTGTWTAAANPHVITSPCTVPIAGSLVIESGAIVQPAGGGSATLYVNGTLTATSASFDRIYVETSSGSTTSIQGGTYTQPASYWGVWINGGSFSIQNATLTGLSGSGSFSLVRYGGTSTGTIGGNTLSLPGTNAGTAVEVTGTASPVISGNDFQDNSARSQTYVRLDVGAASTASVTGNTFRASGGDVPISLAGAAIAAPLTISGNTYPTGPGAGALVSGSITTPATLVNPDGLVVTVESITLSSGAALSIPATTQITSISYLFVSTGATLTLPASGSLTLGGLSLANGVSVTVPALLNVTCTGTWTVSGGATLTLSAGSQLHGPVGSYASLNLTGTLSAASTTLDRIYVQTYPGSSASIQGSTYVQPATYYGFWIAGGDVDIQNSTLTGQGSGSLPLVKYLSNATGTFSGNTIGLAGAGPGLALAVEADATPAITGNDFLDNAAQSQTYVELRVSATNTASVTGNTFRASGGDVPIRLIDHSVGSGVAISGNTYPTGPGGGAVVSGTIAVPATLAPPDGLPLLVFGLTQSSGATLTVPAGLEVAVTSGWTVGAGAALTLAPGAALRGPTGSWVTLNVTGSLSATSATFERIYVQTQTGSTTSLQGVTFTQPSYWGLWFGGGDADVQNCALTGEGSGSYPLVRYTGASTGTFSGNTLSLPGADEGNAVEVQGTASPLISGNDFLDNAARSQTYVELDVGASSTASVTGNTFRASGGDVPIRLAGSSAGASLTISANTYPTGPGGGAVVSGTIAVPATLAQPDGLPLLVTGLTQSSGATLTVPAGLEVAVTSGWTVGQGAALTLAPGAALRGPTGSYATLNVTGSLSATSATFERIHVLTNTGSATSLQGVTFTQPPYYGLWFAGGDADVQNCALTGEGSGSYPLVKYSGASTGTFSGNTLSLPGADDGNAVELQGTASPLISGNDFLDNAAQSQTYVALDLGASSTASITGNTFRASGGDVPFRLSGNSAGSGAAIAGNTYPTGPGGGAVVSGTIAIPATLARPDGLPLLVFGLTQSSGATLTVPAGLEVAVTSSWTVGQGAALTLAPGAALRGPTGSYATLNVTGSLSATSATFERISLQTNTGSTTSLQGVTFTQPPYYGLWFAGGDADVQSCTLTGGGSGSYPLVWYTGASTGTFGGNTLSLPGTQTGNAIDVQGTASPEISGNDFLDNAGQSQTYVDLDVAAASTASVTGNTFRASGGDVPILRVNGALIAPLVVSGNLYPTGAGAGNRLGGTLDGPLLLRRIDGQATVTNSLSVNAGGVLTIDAASGVVLAGLAVASGGAVQVLAGTTLVGTGTVTVQSGGSLSLDRVVLSGLTFAISGDATIVDSDLTGLTGALSMSNGRLTLLRSRLAGTGTVLSLTGTSVAGTVRDNVFERGAANTGVILPTAGANVLFDRNEFRVSGVPWFTQRAAHYGALAAGTSHVCGVLESGELRCGGTNTSGQASPPAVVATRVAAGATHSCALRFDGTPVCWGSAGPHTALPATPYRRIAAGNGFTCAIRQIDRGLECFGAIAAPPAGTFTELSAGRESGQAYACALGTDARIACWGTSSFGAASPPGLAFSDVSAGDRHACARLPDGTVQCWGSNASGQATPAPGAFAELASGALHACGRRADGTVACWGANGSGQSTAPSALFAALAAGGTQTCALRLDGAPQCWGSATATSALSSLAEVGVAVGGDHACAARAGFGLGCWGQNGSGQATPPAHPVYLHVGAGTGFGCASYSSALFTGSESLGFDCWGANGSGQATENTSARFAPALGLNHACALTTSGTAVCWGDDSFGQASPPPGTQFRALAAGTRHTCGITILDTLGCWGSPANGRTSPPGGMFTKLAAGPDHSCALRNDGTVLCWGLNDFGQTTVVPGVYVDVAAGDVFSCALRGDGEAVCWGSAANGRTSPPPGPFARMDAGGGHACAVRANGAIGCWGAALGGAPAPNDLDVDGITDGGDNCPVDGNFTQADGEADAHGDVCDNCPITYARDQEDRDGDLVGDACDNCVSVINPGQEDADLNGFGDACEDATVILRFAPPPPPPGPPGLMPPPAPGDQEYDIFVACGTLPIQRVELGVILPQGTLPANVSFGPGCTSTTCAAATGLGATVNANLSRALGPGLATPGTRPDAVYFSLVGSGPPDNRLCSPFQEVQAGRFVLANSPIAPPVPNLTTEGLAPLGLVPLTDAFNRVMLPEEYGFVAQDATPVLGLSLQPALHDTTGRKWQVELDANLALSRVSFGLVAPAGTTTAQMRFTGCTTLSGSPATRRICAANAALGAYVAPATTFTVGPGAATSGLRSDTLYVSVGGALASGAPLPALNAAQQPTLLGVVELDTTTLQPALTADGLGTASVFATPFVDVSGQAVPPQAVQIAGGYNAPSDYDADARSDDLDNCPFTANNDQVDRGGLATIVPNGRGDRCECGEATDDGAIFAADTAVIRDLLAGKAVASPVVARDRCSVASTPGCDVADLAILRRSLAGFGPFPLAACTTAVR